MCEAFNVSILEARHKSIITMLEEIRVKIMTRIAQKKEFPNQWKNSYGPLVKAKFDKQKKDGIEWRVVWNRDNKCEEYHVPMHAVPFGMMEVSQMTTSTDGIVYSCTGKLISINFSP
ncbi:hypothetical protein DITRI_Ditri13aG0046200 [Diplodiscus trichospermus]